MGKELSILAVVGSLVFIVWYLNKEGCKGDGSSGITGPEGSLCWSGESLSDMLGGIGGGSTEEEPVLTSSGDPAINETPVKPITLQRNIRTKREQTDLQSKLHSRFGPGVNPNAAEYARSYFVNNRITVA